MAVRTWFRKDRRSDRGAARRAPLSRLRWTLGLAALGWALPWFAAVLAVVPTPGPARANFLTDFFMSENQEKQIAEQEHPKILEAFGGEYDDPALARYVGSIASFLGRTSERPDIAYRITILNSPVVNAFALPAGYLYVTRGLLALADNEAELAGVIAHEIGHVTARHPAQRYSRTVMAQSAVGILGVLTRNSELAGLADAAAPAVFGVLQGFSHEQEHEADQLGVVTMSRAGYDPRAMSSFLGKLQAKDKLEAAIADRPDNSGQLNLFATHPRTLDRVQRTVQAASGRQVRDPMTERQLYLGKIDGLLYGDDPAQGFVRGRLFAHPKLGIRFEVPPDFQLLNGQKQVIARGPEGATIQFDMAPGRPPMGPADYMTNVWAKEQPLREVERITVNGFPAATATLRKESQQGPVDLRLLTIQTARKTINRFLFVTPARLTKRFENELRRTTYSFRRLSKAERRRLKPYRLSIATARSGDTAKRLAARTPFPDHRLARFRVLNGLDEGAEPRTGEPVKLVVEER